MLLNETCCPKVSILVPLYNQEKYFGKCIRSICKQTYKNLEIIVVNDGSTDRSLEILQQWAKKDNRIKVVDKKNEGLIMARFDAYRMATGEFVTPVDSDDYLPENAIEILVGHMIEKNVDLVQGSVTRVLGFLKKKYNSHGENDFPFNQVVSQPELFDKYYITFFGKGYFPIIMCSKLYRKSVIDKAMKKTKLCSSDFPFVGEDHYFNMKLFPFVKSMYMTDETVYYYRYGGMSTSHFSPTYPSLFTLSDERLKLLDHYQLTDGYRSLYFEYCNTVYYHAQQLIKFKHASMEDVICFFKDESSKRILMPRMIDHFNNNETTNRRVQLMVKQDFEGMYDLVTAELKSKQRSIKAICKRLFMRFLDLFV